MHPVVVDLTSLGLFAIEWRYDKGAHMWSAYQGKLLRWILDVDFVGYSDNSLYRYFAYVMLILYDTGHVMCSFSWVRETVVRQECNQCWVLVLGMWNVVWILNDLRRNFEWQYQRTCLVCASFSLSVSLLKRWLKLIGEKRSELSWAYTHRKHVSFV